MVKEKQVMSETAETAEIVPDGSATAAEGLGSAGRDICTALEKVGTAYVAFLGMMPGPLDGGEGEADGELDDALARLDQAVRALCDVDRIIQVLELRESNGRLRDENAELRGQLAAAGEEPGR